MTGAVPRRALLVEDNDLRARAMQRFLRARGFEVERVSTADEAIALLELVRPGAFDFASLDCELEGADVWLRPEQRSGMRVARAIAAMAPCCRPQRVEVHSADDDAVTAMLEVLAAGEVDAAHWRLV